MYLLIKGLDGTEELERVTKYIGDMPGLDSLLRSL